MKISELFDSQDIFWVLLFDQDISFLKFLACSNMIKVVLSERNPLGSPLLFFIASSCQERKGSLRNKAGIILIPAYNKG